LLRTAIRGKGARKIRNYRKRGKNAGEIRTAGEKLPGHLPALL